MSVRQQEAHNCKMALSFLLEDPRQLCSRRAWDAGAAPSVTQLWRLLLMGQAGLGASTASTPLYMVAGWPP